MYKVTKIYDGFSTCFRQWKAVNTHCQYLHGYDISIKVIYKGPLDKRNWVVDFGIAKRKTFIYNENKTGYLHTMTLNDWFKYMFDHTVIIAEDDPELKTFQELDEKNIIQLRIIKDTGCEKFAEFIHKNISNFIKLNIESKEVKVVSVEVKEHHKNSAIYEK